MSNFPASKEANIQVRLFQHRGGKYLRIDFKQYDSNAKYRCKQIEGYRYSATHSCWYFPCTSGTVTALRSAFPGLSIAHEVLEEMNLEISEDGGVGLPHCRKEVQDRDARGEERLGFQTRDHSRLAL